MSQKITEIMPPSSEGLNITTTIINTITPIINLENFTKNGHHELVQFCFEPPDAPVTSSVARDFILFLYIFTVILSLVSNGAVIAVQLFNSRSNYNFRFGGSGIRPYLISLAVSDIFLVLTISPDAYATVVLGEWMGLLAFSWICPTVRYLQILGAFVTTATLTLIGAERYIVILHPHSRFTQWFQAHNRALLLASWTLGFVYAYIGNTANVLEEFWVDNDDTVHYQCTVDYHTSRRKVFVVGHFLFSFIFPLVVIVASYAAILDAVQSSFSGAGDDKRRRGRRGSSITEQLRTWWFCGKDEMTPDSNSSAISVVVRLPRNSVDQRVKSIKMMLIVMVMYCTCWAPIKLFQLLNYYGLVPNCSQVQFHWWIASYVSANWLAMANCFVNPFIYSFMSCNFRDDFCRICLFVWRFLVKLQRTNSRRKEPVSQL